jgi:RNA polymerase sigma-70 factor (ECF subfamily)
VDLRPLIDGAIEGDDRATRELVRATQLRVRSLCTSLGSGDDVDDLVQETYLRAWRSLPGFRGDSRTFLVWVLRIARNTCADQVRRRSRQRDVVRRLALAPGEDLLVAAPARAELDDLLARLPPNWRTAFVLTQELGLAYAEAAAVCECPIGTIRSRVARARGRLLALLEERADTPGGGGRVIGTAPS